MHLPYLVDLYSESLVAELHRMGVRHLARLSQTEPDAQPIPPATLISALMQSEDARLQAALILLFLRQPTYSQSLPEALHLLPEPLAAETQLYYQAAVYLQYDLESALRRYVFAWQPLPDLFSAALNLPSPNPNTTTQSLQALGHVHAQLTGLSCNWSESYRQNIPRFLKHLEHDYQRHGPRATQALPG